MVRLYRRESESESEITSKLMFTLSSDPQIKEKKSLSRSLSLSINEA